MASGGGGVSKVEQTEGLTIAIEAAVDNAVGAALKKQRVEFETKTAAMEEKIVSLQRSLNAPKAPPRQASSGEEFLSGGSGSKEVGVTSNAASSNAASSNAASSNPPVFLKPASKGPPAVPIGARAAVRPPVPGD